METDGIMVARGDLGVEMDLAEVPILQKRIVSLCHQFGKPVIVTPQMLQSMINSPSPTRAEVSDVANAIFDGVDAVMLSGEAAVGKWPVKAVKIMSRIELLTNDPITSFSGVTIARRRRKRYLTPFLLPDWVIQYGLRRYSDKRSRMLRCDTDLCVTMLCGNASL